MRYFLIISEMILCSFSFAQNTRDNDSILNRGKEDNKAIVYNITPDHQEICYGPFRQNTLDLWMSRVGSESPRPLLIFIHGGSYSGGSKAQVHEGTLAALLNSGISVASINYRLTDRRRFQLKCTIQPARYNS